MASGCGGSSEHGVRVEKMEGLGLFIDFLLSSINSIQ